MLRIILAALCATALTACAMSGSRSTDHVLNVPTADRHNEALWAAAGDETCYTERTPYNFAGGLTARECVLRNIMRASERSLDPDHAARLAAAHTPPIQNPATSATAIHDMRRYATQLATFYQMRSGRQQEFMDTSAFITQFAGIGAVLSEGAGANTQTIWLQVAFTPVLVSHVNANEPTRELFFAGALAVDLINMRYLQVSQRTAAFRTFDTGAARPACAPFATALVEARNLPAADKTVIEAEAQRLLTACEGLDGDVGDMRIAARGAETLSSQWTAQYASDLIELDRILLHKDHQFRYSPAESLGAIAASPFRTIGTLLSGEDADAALKKLETEIAFEGMEMWLEPIGLPERRPATATITPLSDAVRLRRTASTNARTREIANRLESAATALITFQRENAHRAVLLNEIYAAAQSRYLDFDYVTSTDIVRVTLGSGPPETTPENTRTTPPPAE